MNRIVLVHGAWHGAWCWDPVVDRLEGCDVVTVDLPSVGSPATFADDVAVVRDAIGGVPSVLCGHSYGGAVISEAAASPDVVATVFLCAFALVEGESLTQHAAPGAVTVPSHVEGDFLVLDPATANETFYADVHPDLAAAAIMRLQPQSLGIVQPVSSSVWTTKPSTYVVCTQDRAIVPDRQRIFAGRCGEVLEWECSHSPMLSRPDDVAGLLRRVAA